MPEVVLQTVNERLSDIATDIAYLTNLVLLHKISEEELPLVRAKIEELESEKQLLKGANTKDKGEICLYQSPKKNTGEKK